MIENKHTPSEKKLRQINKIYNDTSILHQFRHCRGNITSQINSAPRNLSKNLSHSPSNSLMINVQFSNYKDYKITMPPLSSIKSHINLVPLHTPKSSYGSLTNIDAPLISQQSNKRSHKKQFSIGTPPIAVGKEVIFFNNRIIDNISSVKRKYKKYTEPGINENNSFNNSFQNISNSSTNKKTSAERRLMENVKSQINPVMSNVRHSISTSLIDNKEAYRPNELVQINENSDIVNENNLELMINKLSTRKDMGIGYLNDIKIGLDGLFDNNLENICKSQKNILLLKKVKQAYEKYIVDLVQNKYSNSDHIINKGLKEENKILLKKNDILKANLDELTTENVKLSQLLINYKIQSNSPPRIILNTEKKVKSPDDDNPPITKTNQEEKLDEENLKQMIKNQQNIINMYKNKEIKMIRLLYAIKKQGFDIEKIYNEEVKGVYQMPNLEEYDLPTIDKNKNKLLKDSSIVLMGKQMELLISVDRERNSERANEKEERQGANINITPRVKEDSFDTETPSSNLLNLYIF